MSRQSVSKWENGQSFPSFEIIIRLSDFIEITIDELLRRDEKLKEKVIKDGEQLAHPKLKFLVDMLFLIGFAFLILIIGII